MAKIPVTYLAFRIRLRYNSAMALIPAVGRNSLRSRLILTALYCVLVLGAVTTVYPFLLMLSQSVTSDFDQTRYDIVPRYLTSTRPLFGKYAEEKFGGNIDQINAAYGTKFVMLQDVSPPSVVAKAETLQDWNGFVASLPTKYKSAGFAGNTASYSPSRMLDLYRKWLTDRFHGNIHTLNRTYLEEDDSFQTVFPPFEQPTKHTWAPDGTVKTSDWELFERTLPPSFFIIDRADPLYGQWLKEEAGYTDIHALNAAWGSSYVDFRDITLPSQPEGDRAERADWETFVRTRLPFRYLAVMPGAAVSYRVFLTNLYHGRIKDYNRGYGTHATSFAALPLPDADSIPPSGPPLLDWIEFINKVPLTDVRVDSTETRYRTWMAAEHHMSPSEAATLPIPAQSADWSYVLGHVAELRRSYLVRNYSLVFNFMALHGPAAANTMIYCFLAVVTALIVNPLCAYALSRYNLPYGSTVLLYLLATMAFPAEVTQIPNFLLLKQLGLLNTFAALVLPGAASGYSIFLLKSFFDSLPKELYEAASIDGASEALMFWKITLPVARPIFAVIGLQSFTVAYASFLFALVVCPNPKIWTMSVWLYELQATGAPQYVMLAADVLSSLPLLLIFIFAQRTIMRGIILPSFK